MVTNVFIHTSRRQRLRHRKVDLWKFQASPVDIVSSGLARVTQ